MALLEGPAACGMVGSSTSGAAVGLRACMRALLGEEQGSRQDALPPYKAGLELLCQDCTGCVIRAS